MIVLKQIHISIILRLWKWNRWFYNIIWLWYFSTTLFASDLLFILKFTDYFL